MRKPTIYQALKNKLNREPTNEELKVEVKRILEEANEMLKVRYASGKVSK